MNAATARPDILSRMIDLLEQEYGALRRADGAAVTRIADDKRKLAETLAGLDWPTDAAADAPAGADADTGTDIGADIGALLSRCHDLNRRNGELLHLQQGMLTRALRVLSGGDSSPATYGARGQANSGHGGRHIASV